MDKKREKWKESRLAGVPMDGSGDKIGRMIGWMDDSMAVSSAKHKMTFHCLSCDIFSIMNNNLDPGVLLPFLIGM